MGNPILPGGWTDPVGNVFEALTGVTHGDSNTGPANHFDIIGAVAKADIE